MYFKIVPGYVGYVADIKGNVYACGADSFDRVLIVPTRVSGDKYLHYNIDGWRVTGHVLIMYTFVGPRPAGMHVYHKNEVPIDNRLANLFYATVGDRKLNVRNSMGQYQLTHIQQQEIHHKIQNGLSYLDAASEYNISEKYAYELGHVRMDLGYV